MRVKKLNIYRLNNNYMNHNEDLSFNSVTNNDRELTKLYFARQNIQLEQELRQLRREMRESIRFLELQSKPR